MRRDQRSCDAGARPFTDPNQRIYTRDGRPSRKDAPTGSRHRPGRPCTTDPQLPKEWCTTTVDRRRTGENRAHGDDGPRSSRTCLAHSRRPHPSSISRKCRPRDVAYGPAHRHLPEVCDPGRSVRATQVSRAIIVGGACPDNRSPVGAPKELDAVDGPRRSHVAVCPTLFAEGAACYVSHPRLYDALISHHIASNRSFAGKARVHQSPCANSPPIRPLPIRTRRPRHEVRDACLCCVLAAFRPALTNGGRPLNRIAREVLEFSAEIHHREVCPVRIRMTQPVDECLVFGRRSDRSSSG